MSKSSRKKNDLLTLIQNQIRGAVSIGRSKTIDVIDLLRELLTTNQQKKLLKWIAFYPQEKRKIFSRKIVRNYDELRVRKLLKESSVEIELLWVAEYLAINSDLINRFLNYKKDINKSVLRSDFENALEILNHCENELGKSLWGVQLQIALLNDVAGVDKQNEFKDRVLESSKGSLAACVAYFSSIRNSDSYSSEVFKDRLNQFLLDVPIQDPHKQHINYKLTAQLPNDSAICMNILRVEFTTSVIDLYETFLDVFTHLMCFDQSVLNATDINKALSSLGAINDSRIEKIRIFQNQSFHQIEQSDDPDPEIDNLIFNDELEPLVEKIKQDSISSLETIKRVVYFLVEKGHRLESPEGIQQNLIALLYDLKSMEESYPNSHSSLEKLSMNYSGISMGKYIRENVDVKNDLFLLRDKRTYFADGDLHPDDILYLDYIPTNLSNRPDSLIKYELEIKLLSLKNKFHEAVTTCEELIEKSDSAAVHRILSRASCVSLSEINDKTTVERMASLCAVSDSVKYTLPFAKFVGVEDWEYWEDKTSEISSVIALSLLLSTNDDEDLRNTLRDLTDEFLDVHMLERPHEILSISEQFPNEQLVYFLENICVPSILDTTGRFENSLDLINERIKICSLLAKINPANKESYEEELKYLIAMNKVNDGIKALDQSRIFVEQEPIKLKVRKSLGELFESYKKFDDQNSRLDYEEFLNALRDFSENLTGKSLDEFIVLPKNESIDILKRLLRSLKEEFLNNTDYGLDSYLSMRIRHGTLYGTLSSPIKQQGLMLTKDSEGEYVANDLNMPLLHMIHQGHRERVFVALTNFTETFNSAIDLLKNEKLQIESSTKPSGVFHLDVENHPVYLRSFMTDINEDTTFDEFFDLTFLFFWRVLAESLNRARRAITEANQKILDGLDYLRKEIEEILPEGALEKTNFVRAIAQARTSFPHEVDRVSRWFTAPDENISNSIFKIEEVIDVSIEIIHSLYPDFRPAIDKEINLEFPVDSRSLYSVTDVLFIMLDNVHNHCGSSEPKVEIFLDRFGEDAVIVRVTSSLALSPDEYRIREIESLKTDVTNNANPSQRKNEGRSGMYKLYKYANQKKPDSLYFGFEDDRFVVQLVMPTRFKRKEIKVSEVES